MIKQKTGYMCREVEGEIYNWLREKRRHMIGSNLECVNVVVDPFDGHGHVQQAIVSWRVVIPCKHEIMKILF
jgi:hypothetical protein